MIDPEIARMRGTLAAHSRWASEPDRTSATAKMRAGFLGKLQREAREKLGPGATDEQVAKLADNALKAHYAKMRLASLKARRRNAAARDQAGRDATADAVLSAEAEADAS